MAIYYTPSRKLNMAVEDHHFFGPPQVPRWDLQKFSTVDCRIGSLVMLGEKGCPESSSRKRGICEYEHLNIGQNDVNVFLSAPVEAVIGRKNGFLRWFAI